MSQHKHPIKTEQASKAVQPARKNSPAAGNTTRHDSIADSVGGLQPATAIRLQRAIGNAATHRLIQRKLTVGAAHDPLEQEADRVADQVVSRSPIQRNPEEGELQAKRNVISRAPQDEEELMTKRNSMLGSFDAGSDFEHKLGSSGSGAPLDGKTRSEMEAGIGADFSRVRVHTGAHASSLNRSISAKAFTRGSDVFFDKGQYNPGSIAGRHLLAHELMHVVQQGGAEKASVQRKTTPHIQRDFWDRFKKKKADAPQTAAWQRHGYRDSSNRDTRIGALSMAGYRVAEHRRMSNDFKWMEQAMANNVDMTEDTEANFYMNEGRRKASSHASDMDQFSFMQDQMSNAWWALIGAKSPLWQHANESFRAPRQEQNNQFLSKANQMRWLGERQMQMAGKQKVDPHDPFKTYKGGDIFTAEANGDPYWDQHAGKRMAYVDHDDDDQLPGYEEVPESYGPGIESPAEMIDMGDEIDKDGDDEAVSVDDLMVASGETTEEGEPQPETAPQSQTQSGATNREQTLHYQKRQENAHRYNARSSEPKKKGLTAKQARNLANNHLNPVQVVKKLHRGLEALQKQSRNFDKWDRAIRGGNQMLSSGYAKKYSGIWDQKVTPAKAARVVLLYPVQGSYVLMNTQRAKKLYKQHRAKWGGRQVED